MYFFQAGTEELVNEWVSTCNYWAARQSKEPLAGGVSNMEYGWNRVLDGTAPTDTADEKDHSDTLSVRSARSNRSSRSRLSKKDFFTMRSATSPYERIVVHDWRAPVPSTVASAHDEETQLESLQRHLTNLKQDFKQHNELRTPMAQLVCEVFVHYNARSIINSYLNVAVSKPLIKWQQGHDKLGT